MRYKKVKDIIFNELDHALKKRMNCILHEEKHAAVYAKPVVTGYSLKIKYNRKKENIDGFEMLISQQHIQAIDLV